MSLITLRNITLGSGSDALYEKANLLIEPKARICLIGRNGAGKSTLFKLLQGDITPDKGEVERQQHVVIMQYPNDQVNALSGGLIRRVLMARAFVAEPDILLLDEPTNHLDIEAIIWLEEFLVNYKKTVIFITHDKSFLQQLATQIVEIDNGKLVKWDGDYVSFLRFKEEQLAAEQRANELFDKKLAEEERWIRQGIKARRTRNEGRVRLLKDMRNERKQRRSSQGELRLQQQGLEKGGKVVFEATNINYSINNTILIKDFSTIIAFGDKVGIIGPNGCGKSTLLKLLLGALQPDSGSVKQGTKITLGYFDQRREQLDESKTVQENIYAGGEFLTINDKTIHVVRYLNNFLFTAEQGRNATRGLSGGERNRLILARLFSKPSNVLVLDEPTNDLDMETLELLQEYLLDYRGTILLVSHDRDFLDNVSTSTIVFEGNGQLTEYNGGYNDYIQAQTIAKKSQKTKTIKTKPQVTKQASKSSYKNKIKLEQLCEQIEALEQEQHYIQHKMIAVDFYKQDSKLIVETRSCLDDVTKKLDILYAELAEMV